MVVAFSPILAEDCCWAFKCQAFAFFFLVNSRTHPQSLKRRELNVFFSKFLCLTIGRFHFAAFNRQVKHLTIFRFLSFLLSFVNQIVGGLLSLNVTVNEIRQQALKKIGKRKFVIVISVHSSENRTYIIVGDDCARILTLKQAFYLFARQSASAAHVNRLVEIRYLQVQCFLGVFALKFSNLSLNFFHNLNLTLKKFS